MRFFNAQIIILALFIGVVATTSANAQFREVTPDQPNETSALVPTKQPFVKPKIEAEPAEAAAVEDSSESADSGSQKTEPEKAEPKEAEPKEAESKEAESKETESKETETELSSSETDKISGVDPYKSFRITKKDGATAPSPSDQIHHSPVVFDGIEPGVIRPSMSWNLSGVNRPRRSKWMKVPFWSIPSKVFVRSTFSRTQMKSRSSRSLSI